MPIIDIVVIIANSIVAVMMRIGLFRPHGVSTGIGTAIVTDTIGEIGGIIIGIDQ